MGIDCAECSKTFNNEKSLEQHTKDKHKSNNKEFIKEDTNNVKVNKLSRKVYKAEKNMIFMALAAFALLSLAETVFYFAFLKNAGLTIKYLQFIFYLILSTVLIGSAVWHIKHYRIHFTCSTGMMVGMIIGMMSGFMIGAIIGATNGMFIGSVTGILTGMTVGAWCTRTCGIMSILEGMMAGLMAGLMGAMTTVMLINDNLLLFMPLLMGSTSIMLVGMSYMIYKEHEEQRENVAKLDKYDSMLYVSAMFIFAIAVTMLIVWGPKSVITIGL